MALLSFYKANTTEAGCDEAGRGCLAGPVVAAAVILPQDYKHPVLNDSKKLTAKQRDSLKDEIKSVALAWSIGIVSHQEIDEINILNASSLEKHKSFRPHAVVEAGTALQHKSLVFAPNKPYILLQVIL